MSGRVVLLLLLGAASATSSVEVQGAIETRDPRVESLSARRDGARLLVSFRLVDLPSAEELERLHSGIPISYRHRIDVVSRRAPWPAKLLARAKIEATAEYDSLTKRYRLRREVQLRNGAREIVVEPLERETGSVEEVQAWLTEVESFPVLELCDGLSAERSRVRVQTAFGRRYVMLLFPARRAVGAECRPELR